MPDVVHEPDLAPRVAAGVRLTTLQQGFEQVVRVLFAIVLARFVEPADFGLMSMAFVATYLAILVSDLGVGAALVHRRDLRPEHVATAFTASAACGVLLCGLLLAAAGPVAALFDEPRLTPVLAVLSVTFVCKGLQGVPRDLLRRNLRFAPYTATAAVALVAGVAVGVAAGVAGAGVWALVAYSVVESVLAMVLSLAVAWRSGAWRPAIGFDRAAARELAPFAGFMLGARGLHYVQASADSVVVGRLLGAGALGFYGLAYRTMLVPVQKIADVVSNVAMPALAIVQDDVARVRTGYLRAQQAAAVVSFPMSLGVAASAPVLVPTLLGRTWTPAVTTVQILALNGPRLVIGRLAGALFQATGRPSWDFWLLVIGVPLSIVAFVIGASHGIAGVATGLTVAGTALFTVQLVLVARVLRSSVLAVARPMASVVVASAAMVGVVLATMAVLPATTGNLIESAVVVAGGAGTYIGVLAALDRSSLTSLVADVMRGRQHARWVTS